MDAVAMLNEKHIRLSGLRVKILDYLITHKTHPTIDEIYEELLKDNPTLSKTTVYNTVKVLEKNNLAKAVTIDERQIRYDGNISYHGHFRCKSCGNIYDFETGDVPSLAPDGFSVDSTDFYCVGNCINCNNKN